VSKLGKLADLGMRLAPNVCYSSGVAPRRSSSILSEGVRRNDVEEEASDPADRRDDVTMAAGPEYVMAEIRPVLDTNAGCHFVVGDSRPIVSRARGPRYAS
jgi:hypothetical protein